MTSKVTQKKELSKNYLPNVNNSKNGSKQTTHVLFRSSVTTDYVKVVIFPDFVDNFPIFPRFLYHISFTFLCKLDHLNMVCTRPCIALLIYIQTI